MKLSSILSERVVTRFRTNVQLNVEIVADTTRHAEERKFRHEVEISDAEIRSTVFKATERIMQGYVDGKLKDENDKFWIYDRQNKNLNIIGTFVMNHRGTPETIRIVTIMRHDNFHPNDVKLRVIV